MTKLVILRGPSASGKSTIAHALREKSQRKIAILEFDTYRNNMLAKQVNYYNAASEMFINDTLIAFKHGYDVIMDGIFRFEGSNEYLEKLLDEHPEENYMFYFDITLEETLKRHHKRDKSMSFSEDKMREWYYRPTASGYGIEKTIPQNSGVQETVEMILSETGL